MSTNTVPLVSCLCVTEGREAFMPWLLWCFDRQQWRHRELVIVDSSPHPFNAGDRSDVRVVVAPPGVSVAHKRNQALREARGEIVTWFDDDDWQHPQKLDLLVERLSRGAAYAGVTKAWFVDLITRHCTPFGGPKQEVIFNSAGFQRQAVMEINFPENVLVASDTRWMQQLIAQHLGRAVLLDREDLFFWLCHEKNLSNPARRRRFTKPLHTLKNTIGTEAWGDTDEALDALQSRLTGAIRSSTAQTSTAQTKIKPKATVSVPGWKEEHPPVESAPRLQQVALDGEQPAVGVMIKVTAMDVPYLETMVRHMIAQAQYPFAERTIVVDRPTDFAGKYRDRPRASEEELNRLLKQLLAEGLIDHVREVDMTPKVVPEVMDRYFVAGGEQVPTHAITGGPIYATLYGMESMSTDYVLQMDCDMFFYTGAESWVSQALDCLRHDPRLWLMMAHPGPPIGPLGHSLAGSNTKRATWDSEMHIWRFRTATSRYFLCDRRKLHKRLQPVLTHGGCAPLEQCISQALQRHGTFRGNLGNLQNWHLHGWYHRDPFPNWAPALALAIASNQLPALQRGEYDLRLDRDRDRLAWQHLLASINQESVHATQPSAIEGKSNLSGLPMRTAVETIEAESRQVVSRANTRGSAIKVAEPIEPKRSQNKHTLAPTAAPDVPLAVILPVRDRAGQRLRNALHSLHWQTIGSPNQILVVSHGSQPQINDELAKICQAENATLLTIGNANQPWNKPLALNSGIRATLPNVPFLMTMDIDMILAPNFVEVVLEGLAREPASLVLCQSADLPEHVTLPVDSKQFLASFQQLHRASQLRSRTGTGGIQAARRSFFFDIRGYDEDLVWWGAMDGDIVSRGRLLDLRVLWVDNKTAMLHQWHPRKHAALSESHHIEQARQAWQRNHELVRTRAQTAQRNPQGWGGIAE